jgi:hypothetical protein
MRLSNYIMDNIVGRALHAAFHERQQALRQAEHDLAMAAWEHLFPAEERAAALAMPKRWVRMDKCLQVTFGYRRTSLDLIGDGVPVPASDGCARLGTVYDREAGAVLHERFMDLERAKAALNTERDAARGALYGLMKSARSLKRLAEIWPQGEAFYLAELQHARLQASVPAVVSDEVNKLLGLPQAAGGTEPAQVPA